jgi:biotin carboxyl carrier protein
MAKKEKYDTLCIGGTMYKTTLTNKFLNRKVWEAPNEKMVKAYIPGNIPKIFVTVGQKVKEGSKLLMLEAMKMKSIVVAPVSGTIKAIYVKEGDRIPKQTLLVEIE